jgi:hypothetical protein
LLIFNVPVLVSLAEGGGAAAYRLGAASMSLARMAVDCLYFFRKPSMLPASSARNCTEFAYFRQKTFPGATESTMLLLDIRKFKLLKLLVLQNLRNSEFLDYEASLVVGNKTRCF